MCFFAAFLLDKGYVKRYTPASTATKPLLLKGVCSILVVFFWTVYGDFLHWPLSKTAALR
jgi:hypothetical protein